MNLVEIMMKFATENEVDSKHLKLWLVVSITWKLSFVVLGIVIKIIRKLDHSHIVALCEKAVNKLCSDGLTLVVDKFRKSH